MKSEENGIGGRQALGKIKERLHSNQRQKYTCGRERVCGKVKLFTMLVGWLAQDSLEHIQMYPNVDSGFRVLDSGTGGRGRIRFYDNYKNYPCSLPWPVLPGLKLSFPHCLSP